MINSKDKRHITIVGKGGGGQAESVDWGDITNKPDFAEVATSGEYDDLENKPQLATVATSGSYNDLTDKPTILTQWFGTQAEYDAIAVKDPNVIYNIEGSDNVQADWNQSDSSADDYIKNKPTIPAAQVNADWNANSGVAQILNKPTIPTVPTDVSAFNNDAGYLDSTDLKDELVDTYNFFYEDPDTGDLTPNWVDFGSMNDALYNYGILDIDAGTGDYVYEPDYNDLQNKPTIPAAQVNADWNANSGVAQILNKPNLATVATTGSYNDLSDKPTVTQEQADWNQTDNTQVDYIKNKPTIPTLPPMTTETLTFTMQGGTTKTVDFYVVANYFYVEDISGSNNTVRIYASDYGLPTITVYKSTDQKNWTSMGNVSTSGITATVPANGRLYLKANAGTLSGGYANTRITCTNSFNVGGYVMSLINGDNFVDSTLNTKCKELFRGSTVVNASDLVLPDNTYANCYEGMFRECTSLTQAPVLPATTLAQRCYASMFFGCTSLTTAPALPATTLVERCYSDMFNGCTALTTAPVLPATTLANYCYYDMFWNCTSLTTAPVLPATTLANYCYANMFYGCSALTTAPTLPAETLNECCYISMFSNCTSLTTAPALPATTLKKTCYQAMFSNCTSLTTAPALPATTVAQWAYRSMFNGCSSLNSVTTYANTGATTTNLSGWLSGVAAQGDFYNLGTATYTSGVDGIPTGWTEHTSL